MKPPKRDGVPAELNVHMPHALERLAQTIKQHRRCPAELGSTVADACAMWR